MKGDASAALTHEDCRWYTEVRRVGLAIAKTVGSLLSFSLGRTFLPVGAPVAFAPLWLCMTPDAAISLEVLR